MENMNRDGEEGERGQRTHSTVQLPPNIYEIAMKPIFNRSRNCESKGEDYLGSRDRSWSRTRSSMQTGSNGLSPVRESRWEIKLMTVKFHIRLWITRYDVPDAEANDTHRWGGWTGMEVRLQLGLGERWFNQPWNLQLCQLWKLSSSVNEASDETTCNENVLAIP